MPMMIQVILLRILFYLVIYGKMLGLIGTVVWDRKFRVYPELGPTGYFYLICFPIFT